MVVEHPLTSAWQSSKSLDRDSVDMALGRRRHHAPLDIGDAALREEDHHVDARDLRNASIAAPPVSPEVAPTIVARWPRLAKT